LGGRKRVALEMIQASFETSIESSTPSKHCSSSSSASAPKQKGTFAIPAWRRGLPYPRTLKFLNDIVGAGQVRYWVEILCNSPETDHAPTKGPKPTQPAPSKTLKSKWVYCDPVRLLVDTPLVPAALRSKSDPIMYVIAASGTGRLTDVTKRYSFDWHESKLARDRSGIGSIDIDAVLEAFEPPSAALHRRQVRAMRAKHLQGSKARGHGFRDAQGHEAAAEEDEERELKHAANAAPIPTSMAAFKKHPVYALDGTLQRTQIIRPGAKQVSLFKGKGVFLRKDIANCLSKDKWL